MSDADGTLRVEVVCVELPGRRFGDLEPVGLGVQHGEEVRDIVMADAKRATFALAFGVGKQKNGKPNFLGPFAQGTPGDRFFYLVWGVKRGEAFERFRRLKVRLGHLSWKSIDESIHAAKPITVRLRMTDKRGGPICATPPPDHVAWGVK